MIATRRQQHLPPRPRRRPEAGAVMITVLLVMVALLGLGVTALWMTSGSVQIGSHVSMRNQALYVAEAGIEAVRADLNGDPPRDVARLLAGGKSPLADNVPVAPGVNSAGQPNGIGGVYFMADGTVLRDVAFPPATFKRAAGTADAPQSATMGTYTVWIRNDTAELRLGRITNDLNGTLVVRSRGVAPDGRTEVVLEVTVGPGPNPPVTPDFCHAGKNACDDNSSTLGGFFVQ